jgi:sugar phosphate isomerase/epimerase
VFTRAMKKSLQVFAMGFLMVGLGFAADKAVGTSKSFKGPTGLQLYSLRDAFKTDVPGTLDKVKAFGFVEVELAGTYGMTAEKFCQELQSRGLVPIAAHFPYDRYRDDPEAVAAEAKALGLKYAGVAWIPHKGDFDEKQCREAATVFNKAGEVLAKHGLKFFYHTHGYEFQPFGTGTIFDLLMQETKPGLVFFEMDLLWTVFPGQDPVKLLERYGNRFELIHLKDLKKGVAGDMSGHTDVRNDVALGSGQMNYPAILKAAQTVGVKHYFIEDESPVSMDQIPQSLRYLEVVAW